MPQLPAKRIGDTHVDDAHNKTIEYLRSLRPMRGNGTFTKHTIFGVSRQAARAKRGGTKPATSGNWNYRGMYDPATTTPYMTYDVVQFGAGTSAGMYLSTVDNNNNSPDTGIGWVQVSTGTGAWL